jgi:hypothetical protein
MWEEEVSMREVGFLFWRAQAAMTRVENESLGSVSHAFLRYS